MNTSENKQAKQYDVVIVGTGAAGLFCALHLPEEMQVLMITKEDAKKSDSYLAQGGISTLRHTDDYDCYFEDTMRAGHYKNDKRAVEIMIRSSQKVIQELIALGVVFEQDKDGFLYTREGAHSINRILHHKDETGREITSVLLAEVLRRPNCTVCEHTQMVDIIVQDSRCVGIVMRNRDTEVGCAYAPAVVFATGGVGGLFENTTNFRHITADGLAVALKHGVKVQDVSCIQIHPTALYCAEGGRRFLISESVRGEGAFLLNEAKERFVDELLPRDIVSNAILEQMEKFHTDHVYLSVTHLPKDKIKKRFPNIYNACLEVGYDMAKTPIPVMPAQHYSMGGIQVDSNGHTSMPSLYAIGEVSCNGVHGANRLASNSLLESLVFAERASYEIAIQKQSLPKYIAKPNLSDYYDSKKIEDLYSALVRNEIKRRDELFYDKWCRHDNQSG